MGNKLKIVLLAKTGALSDKTLKAIISNHGVSHVLIEERSTKKELRTYVNTQGYFRLFSFVLKKVLSTTLNLLKKRTKKFNRYHLLNQNNIPYTIVSSHNSNTSIELIKKISPDLAVICSSRIISEKLIDQTKIGILNCHPGWLPDYRGWDALRWSVFFRKNVGVTAHFIDNGVDTGDIIIRRKLDCAKFNKFNKLFEHALNVRLTLLNESIELIKSGDFQRIKQKNNEGKRFYRMGFFKILKLNAILKKNQKNKIIS